MAIHNGCLVAVQCMLKRALFLRRVQNPLHIQCSDIERIGNLIGQYPFNLRFVWSAE